MCYSLPTSILGAARVGVGVRFRCDVLYLFAYAVDLPSGATSVTLPDDDRIRVLATTVSDEGGRVRPAAPLYDVLDGQRMR